MSTLRDMYKSSGMAEEWDKMLFSLLKSNPDEPTIKHLEAILSLLVTADANQRELRVLSARRDRAIKPTNKKESIELAKQYRATEKSYYKSLNQLNDAMRRYKWVADIGGGKDCLGFELYQREKRNPNKWEILESFVLPLLLEYTKVPGAIARFRRCIECQNWFYAIKGHQQFCGSHCRRHNAAQNPVFKEKRRIYMSERYRPQQKELQERSLTRARGLSQKQGRG